MKLHSSNSRICAEVLCAVPFMHIPKELNVVESRVGPCSSAGLGVCAFRLSAHLQALHSAVYQPKLGQISLFGVCALSQG